MKQTEENLNGCILPGTNIEDLESVIPKTTYYKETKDNTPNWNGFLTAVMREDAPYYPVGIVISIFGNNYLIQENLYDETPCGIKRQRLRLKLIEQK